MDELQLTIGEPSHEWNVYADRETFCVSIKAWHRKGVIGLSDDEWTWNIYAHIYESHPLFSDPEKALNTLQFHWGATYEKFITVQEARGNKYDWQKDGKTLKIGNDYAHYEDDYFMACHPKDGIPLTIQQDALCLVGQLIGMKEIKE